MIFCEYLGFFAIMKSEEMIMRINEKIGFEMRNQRLLHRMTLEQVADKMGIGSKNTISRMELGAKNITIEDLVNYCNAVGCSWIELLYKLDK